MAERPNIQRPTSTILDQIVAAKRNEVARRKLALPEEDLCARAADAPPPRDFFGALGGAPPIRLIAEVKRPAPAAG